MSTRKVKYKKGDFIKPCPKCSNNTDFVIRSEQVCEDGCEIWATCKCGYDPTSYTEAGSGHRIEDVWGGCNDDNCADAIRYSWNEAIEDLLIREQLKNDKINQQMDNNDIIKEVAEKLYYEANPNTKKDVPSYAYEQVEYANKRRVEAKSELSLYDWCKMEIRQSKERGILSRLSEFKVDVNLPLTDWPDSNRKLLIELARKHNELVDEVYQIRVDEMNS